MSRVRFEGVPMEEDDPTDPSASTTPLIPRRNNARPLLPLTIAGYTPSPQRASLATLGAAMYDPEDVPPKGYQIHEREAPAGTNPLAQDLEYGDFAPALKIQHHPDRGSGVYEADRRRHHRASLVETGRHSGKSKVEYKGLTVAQLSYHFWKRDFYTSVTTLRLHLLLTVFSISYMASFLFFAGLWGALATADPTCVAGINSKVYGGAFLSMFLFSVETQQTIGYGIRAPTECWCSAMLLTFQCIWATFLNAVWVGIVFARISHPKNRGRTIFISDSAVIARRDGVLKFMFRLADIRQTQVVSPTVSAFLYTWGAGRTTAEGEHIPARVDRLDLGTFGATLSLLLPIVVEHNIDERSPLYGHTSNSLEALGAEIVVSFQGSGELGQQFMERVSYLWSEIHWGFVFSKVIYPAPPGSVRHVIDLSRFHEVEPQEGLSMLPQAMLSRTVADRPPRTIPFPALTENTLVLSAHLVVAPVDGVLSLMVRVGDTYPNNMLGVCVRMYLYRWVERLSSDGDLFTFQDYELKLGQHQAGQAPLLLRLPKTVQHKIDDASPLRDWRTGSLGMAKDADSEIVVVVEAVHYNSSHSVLQQRSYAVHSDLKWGFRFAPAVTRPLSVRAGGDGKPRIAWSRFHDVLAVGEDAMNAVLLQQRIPGRGPVRNGVRDSAGEFSGAGRSVSGLS